MRLYTVQPKEVIDKVLKNGSFICDPSKSFHLKYPNTQQAYEWMIKKMNSCLKNEDNIQYPIWAWYKIDGTNELPDFNCGIFSNSTCYLLELEMESEDVLLSDFDNWHIPLNNWYFSLCETDEEFDKEDIRLKRLSPYEFEKEKFASWERVLNVKNSYMVQATFWKIKKENIIYIHKIFKSVDLDEVIDIASSNYGEKKKKHGLSKRKLSRFLNNYYTNAQNRNKYLNKFSSDKNHTKLQKKNTFKLSDEEQKKINEIIELYDINKSFLKFVI